MHTRAKIARWLVGAVLAALAFFSIFSFPQDWQETNDLVATTEAWWNAHAEHPALAAFIIGLLLSIVLLPGCIRVARGLFPAKPRPDVEGGVLVNEIISNSKRAKQLVKKKLLTVPLVYETHLNEEEVTENRLLTKIVGEIRDLLMNGDITAWGTPDNKRPYQQIEPEEWSDIELTGDYRLLGGPRPQLHAVYTGDSPTGSAFKYVWLRFCRKQALGHFPLASFPRKLVRNRTDDTHG